MRESLGGKQQSLGAEFETGLEVWVRRIEYKKMAGKLLERNFAFLKKEAGAKILTGRICVPMRLGGQRW